MSTDHLTFYEEPRIGVFVCDCGSNIAGHLDCSNFAEYAQTLPNVVYVKESLYTCSEAGIGEIKKAIKEENLNRVVVASCSPRTHHPLFSSSCGDAGLNPYLFEMVNIRDQCSWVHMGKREEATQKAKELIRMGVAKSAGLEPQKDIESSLFRKILVIGGGIAGLSAAQALADMRLDIILVEKTVALGGLLRQVHKLDSTGESADNTLAGIIDDIRSRSNIICYTNASLRETSGYIGNYDIKIDTQEGLLEEQVGCIVVATGAVPFILEAHAKLRPLDFAVDGIFVCGSERHPATSTEARTQGIEVASRVAAILFKEKLVKSAIVAQINPDTCVGCMACCSMCPYEAINYNVEKKICEVNEILCKGCGNCAATCPSHSAQLRGIKPNRLMACL